MKFIDVRYNVIDQKENLLGRIMTHKLEHLKTTEVKDLLDVIEVFLSKTLSENEMLKLNIKINDLDRWGD